MCCLWKGTLLFIGWWTTNCNYAIANGTVSAVHGLQKRGIRDKIIVSANFFPILTRIGLSEGFLTTFLKDDIRSTLMKQVGNRYLTDVWAVLVQGHGRIVAPDFCVAHREANSGLSTLNRTKSILSIYHQQRQLQKQRGMCLNDTYPFCQQPLSGNCHSICFSKPVLWTTTAAHRFFNWFGRKRRKQ